jgi:hypothetical protein
MHACMCIRGPVETGHTYIHTISQGLLETEHPYAYASRACFEELLAAPGGPEKAVPLVARIVPSLRAGVYVCECVYFCVHASESVHINIYMKVCVYMHVCTYGPQHAMLLTTRIVSSLCADVCGCMGACICM